MVVCGVGEYDLCTALGKKMALILWNKQAHFKGQMNYFSLTKYDHSSKLTFYIALKYVIDCPLVEIIVVKKKGF